MVMDNARQSDNEKGNSSLLSTLPIRASARLQVITAISLSVAGPSALGLRATKRRILSAEIDATIMTHTRSLWLEQELCRQ
jgi:hypothetical protein